MQRQQQRQRGLAGSRPRRHAAPPPRALPLPYDDTNAAANAAAAAAAALGVGLPASVLIDELLDSAAPRVNALTNAEHNGVRLFVARPTGVCGCAGAAGAATSGASGGSVGSGPKSSSSPTIRRPAVVLIHQILGLQKRETDLAHALAEEEGLVVVAPDTFRGQSTSWPLRAITLGFKFALRAGASWGVESVHQAVMWLKSQTDVDPDRIVVAGFCYGGGSAVRYAAAHPGQVAGVAIFYGRPLLQTAEVAQLGRIPVLGLYGTRDSQFPQAMLHKFKTDLAAGGVPYRLELFEGEGHAFVQDLAAVRRGGAAGRAWQLFREFVRQVSRGEFEGA